MENLKDMIDVNTIVGDPVEAPDGTIIIPISKVGFGFAAGGSEFQKENGQKSEVISGQAKGFPFGGGSGGGISISPVAFLVVSKSDVKLLPLDHQTHIYERILDLTPQIVEKVQSLLKQNNKQSVIQ